VTSLVSLAPGSSDQSQSNGIHPFAAQSETQWVLRVESTQPDLYALPGGLDEVIRATLACDPRDRPSARELAAICQSVELSR
jgi:hypothetical protein